MLLPLSGKNSLLGQTIINSIRLYLLDNSTDLSFKVFDTKSSSSGVKIAFQKALNENLKILGGSPAGTRTPTKGTKNLCATITPPGYEP